MKKEEFAAQCGLKVSEIENIYNEIVSSGLSPSNFYVIKKVTENINPNTKKKEVRYNYFTIAKYSFLLSRIIPYVHSIELDIIKHPVMGECAVAIIHRKGFSKPFVWHLPRKSYTTSYDYNIEFMLRKACLSQAIKILFADIFEQFKFNIYTEEELIDVGYNKITNTANINTESQDENQQQEKPIKNATHQIEQDIKQEDDKLDNEKDESSKHKTNKHDDTVFYKEKLLDIVKSKGKNEEYVIEVASKLLNINKKTISDFSATEIEKLIDVFSKIKTEEKISFE